MPVPKGTTLDPERTRSQILATVTPMLYERGVDGIGVAELCDRAGISKQTLYRHFGSKEGLVEAVLEQRSARVGRWLRSAAAEGETPADQLGAVFAALGTWFTEPDFRGCVVMNAATQHRSGPVLTLAGRHLEMYVELFTTIASAAGARDPDTVARQWLQLVEGATLIAAMSGTPGSQRRPDEAARDAGRAALDLLAAATR